MPVGEPTQRYRERRVENSPFTDDVRQTAGVTDGCSQQHRPTAWIASWLQPESTDWLDGNRTNISEASRPPAIEAQLAHLIMHAKCDLARSRKMLDRLGWTTAGARLTPSSSIQKRHGDFGEVLTVAIMEELMGVRVPVVKLRYQMDREQTLPGTDIVGFVMQGGHTAPHIDHLEFTEVKVRVTNDIKVALKAHGQLADDRELGFVETIDFLHQRISDNRPELLDAYEEYLADRREGALDSYRISLIIEESIWSERIFELLPEVPDLVQPISLDVTLIEQLRELIHESWQAVGEDVIPGHE